MCGRPAHLIRDFVFGALAQEEPNDLNMAVVGCHDKARDAVLSRQREGVETSEGTGQRKVEIDSHPVTACRLVVEDRSEGRGAAEEGSKI
jgi:hypothetical protein